MKLNRRSVLGAIGLVGVGTGAAFGSGAFTSTTAERAVEVNVFGDGDGPDGVVELPSDDEEDIADTITDNIVDVLVDTSPSSVSVRGGGNDYEGSDLFPGEDAYNGEFGDFVSLVANDVTIVFGNDGGLPPNSELGYGELFAFVPNSDGSLTFDVTFGDDDQGELLTSVSGELVSDGAVVPVSDGSSDPVDAEVQTGTESPEGEELDIRIEEQ